jgi:hypothetical protein
MTQIPTAIFKEPGRRADFSEQYARACVMGSILSTHPGFHTRASDRLANCPRSVRLARVRRQKPLHGHGADAGLSRYLSYREAALS